MVIPKDGLYRSQWHLAQLGGIETVWNEYSGRGVSVGVYDSGVDYRHPDLAPNYDSTLNFRFGGRLAPVLPYLATGPDHDGHGTSVAGLIAAARNGTGTVGVAWGAGITGVSIIDAPFIDSAPATAAAFAQTAAFDIINASWGYTDSFDGFARFDARPVLAGYDLATETGRGGLGTIIIHAAGNDGSNANGDPVVAPHSVIAVAATGRNGLVTDYSNYGANILVAAPAAEVTTDLPGRQGYNTATGADGNYTVDFNGTSAATPVVSGVVALMLEANPALGWRDVREILATSAAMPRSASVDVNSFEVAIPRLQQMLVDDANPASLDGDTWNDGGRFYSGDYGFGRVDAFAAVRLAEVWTILHGAASTSANLHLLARQDTGPVTPVATKGTVTSASFSLPASGRIEMIDLAVTIQSTATSGENWLVSLVSPTGSVYRLNYDRFKSLQNDNAQGDYVFGSTSDRPNDTFKWKFSIAHALDENLTGDWRFDFECLKGGAGDVTVTGMKLDFFGSDHSADNFHYLTADYRKALLAEARHADLNPETLRDRVITDLNGGTDWLVMATLRDDISASLAPGGSISVGGTSWATIGRTTSIENLVTGDGNDTLLGSDSANRILSMRGADDLGGGGGQDTLQGGTGSDTLSGGSGGDVLQGGDGRDSVSGGDGRDTLSGGDGADTLSGNGGSDRLDGGAEADVFIFAANGGRDRILGFQDNSDTLHLDDALWNNARLSVADVIDRYATVTDEGVLFSFGNHSLLLLGLADPHILLDDLTLI